MLTLNNGMIISYGNVDLDGRPVHRTKEDFPYSYDGFVIWRAGENSEIKSCVYSDRLYQQDYKKFNKLCKKHFGDEGQYFDRRNPEKTEEFLRDWFDKPNLRLIVIMQWCNASSGYPLWSFHFNY